MTTIYHHAHHTLSHTPFIRQTNYYFPLGILTSTHLIHYHPYSSSTPMCRSSPSLTHSLSPRTVQPSSTSSLCARSHLCNRLSDTHSPTPADEGGFLIAACSFPFPLLPPFPPPFRPHYHRAATAPLASLSLYLVDPDIL